MNVDILCGRNDAVKNDLISRNGSCNVQDVMCQVNETLFMLSIGQMGGFLLDRQIKRVLDYKRHPISIDPNTLHN